MSDSIFHLPTKLETRWATHENRKAERGGACRGNDGRKRSACIGPLKAAQTAVLTDISGSPGLIRRIWITINDRSPEMLRGLRLDFHWDGAASPACTVPLGDFFCQGLGKMAAFENEYFSSPEARSFNCIVPMPFSSSARITVTNETGKDLRLFFYEIDFTLGDRHPPEMLYFHAHWRREDPTRLRRDYLLLPKVRGRGRFLGAMMGVVADTRKYFNSWWGEGEVKIHLDGDEDGHPTLCGTGAEDYVGTGWGQGTYAHRYQGCLLADRERIRYILYRLHVPDPVWFWQDIQVAIQQIGYWNSESIQKMYESGIQLEYGTSPIDMVEAAKQAGAGFFERQDDWSSCAWFYLDKPENSLPALPPFEARISGLDAAAAGDSIRLDQVPPP